MLDAIIENGNYYMVVVVRLILACFLGGLIGYERESTNRPAGFRTHILVCVGAALIMIAAENISQKYAGVTNIDPTRLGAQVISGIGFFGAGTIIREGVNVRGLTTAASLWTVSCVGIAAGAGFYSGAVIATAIIYITLMLLKRTEKRIAKKNRLSLFRIRTGNMPGQISTIGCIFSKYNVTIKNIEFLNDAEEKEIHIKYFVRVPGSVSLEKIMDELQELEGVKDVSQE
jgi:putative Mg2+ transporter-C (MgtC) family protein